MAECPSLQGKLQAERHSASGILLFMAECPSLQGKPQAERHSASGIKSESKGKLN